MSDFRQCAMCPWNCAEQGLCQIAAPSPAQTSTVVPDTGAAASGVMGPVVTPEAAIEIDQDWFFDAKPRSERPAPEFDFDTWWRASKYCQVVMPQKGWEQIARDGWNAALRYSRTLAEAGTPGAAATPQGETVELLWCEECACRHTPESARVIHSESQTFGSGRSTTGDME